MKDLNKKKEGLLSCPGIEYMVSVVAKINKKLVKKTELDFSFLELRTDGKLVSVYFANDLVWSTEEREQCGRCVDWHNEEYTDFEEFIKKSVCWGIEDTDRINKIVSKCLRVK